MAERDQVNVNWFPGHMTKALRAMEGDLKLVDAVIELTDARIPRSSRNPALDEVLGNKPRLVLLNRADLADPAATERWLRFYKASRIAALAADSRGGRGVEKLPAAMRSLLKEKLERLAAKGQGSRPIRAMVVGIPNVGKSTFINKAAGRKAAAAGNKPGVTKGRQWITVDRSLELLDTPGVLWPRFEDPAVGEHLAFTGAVKEEILDQEALAMRLAELLNREYRELFRARYKLGDTEGMDGPALLEAAARKRGFLVSGGETDLERMSRVLLDEFQAGSLGRITLEKPEC